MARPQRLGFLPTLWFWQDLWLDRPLFQGFLSMLTGAFPLVLSWCLLDLVGLPIAFIMAAFGPMVGLGLMERGLRRAVRRRRRQLARSPSALPPGSD